MCYDAISGEVMIKELVGAARKVETKTFEKHRAYEKAPIEECWEDAGKAPVGVKWVEVNKGDKENIEYRCRLVAKEIKKDRREDFVRSAAAFGGEEDAALTLGECGRYVFGLRRCSSCFFSWEGKEKRACGAIKGGLRGGQVWTAAESHVRDP